jgi:hypothetical protein
LGVCTPCGGQSEPCCTGLVCNAPYSCFVSLGTCG